MFNLKGCDHQVIDTSESYTTSTARKNGITSVKENAPSAPTHDETA